MEMVNSSRDYGSIVINLMSLVPEIWAVAIIEGQNELMYSTDNWNINEDIISVCSSWDSKKAPFIVVSGVKYTILQCDIDSLVATSVRGEGHIVGCKDDERKIITYVSPHGDIKAAIVEIFRTLVEMSSKKPNIDINLPLESLHEIREEKSLNNLDPLLKSEITSFLEWIKNPSGFQSYINYYLQQDDSRMISEIAKLYNEIRQIFGV